MKYEQSGSESRSRICQGEAVRDLKPILTSTPVAHPATEQPRQREKERGWIDGTRLSSFPQSCSQTARFRCGHIHGTAGGTYATEPGFRITEDVSLLRVDHSTV